MNNQIAMTVHGDVLCDMSCVVITLAWTQGSHVLALLQGYTCSHRGQGQTARVSRHTVEAVKQY